MLFRSGEPQIFEHRKARHAATQLLASGVFELGERERLHTRADACEHRHDLCEVEPGQGEVPDLRRDLSAKDGPTQVPFSRPLDLQI